MYRDGLSPRPERLRAAKQCSRFLHAHTHTHAHTLGSTRAAAQTSRKEQGQIKERSLVRRKCVERLKARTGAACVHNCRWSKCDEGSLHGNTTRAYNVFLHFFSWYTCALQ